MIGSRLVGRSVAVGAAGVLIVAVGGIGIATAANGGSLVLGHANTATSTTTLTDAGGTPLALVGKTSTPPLTVNSSTQVAQLNASMVGGQTAAQLSAGSGAATVAALGAPLSSSGFTPTSVSATAALNAGTYYVSASALLQAATATGAFCYIAITASAPVPLQIGGNYMEGLETATETLPVTVTKGQSITDYCYDNGNSTGSNVFNAGIIAIRIGHPVTGTAAALVRQASKRGSSPVAATR
jgi:hypothetical protein